MARRSPSPLSDFRSFEFGSTLPPGPLLETSPTHDSMDPRMLDPASMAQQYMASSQQQQQPPQSFNVPPPAATSSRSSYAPSGGHPQRTQITTAVRGASFDNGPSLLAYDQVPEVRGSSPHSPGDGNGRLLPRPPPSGSSPGGASPTVGRRRALPTPPGAGGFAHVTAAGPAQSSQAAPQAPSYSSQTAPAPPAHHSQHAQAAPYAPQAPQGAYTPSAPAPRAAQPEPSAQAPALPPRLPHGYKDYVSNLTPGGRPGTVYDTSISPQSAYATTPVSTNIVRSDSLSRYADNSANVNRSQTSSTSHTNATGESYFANADNSNLTPNTSLSSRYSESREKEMLSSRSPPPVDTYRRSLDETHRPSLDGGYRNHTSQDEHRPQRVEELAPREEYRQEPAHARGDYPQEPAYSRDEYRPEPAYSRDEYRQEPAHSRGDYRQEPAYSRGSYHEQPQAPPEVYHAPSRDEYSAPSYHGREEFPSQPSDSYGQEEPYDNSHGQEFRAPPRVDEPPTISTPYNNPYLNGESTPSASNGYLPHIEPTSLSSLHAVGQRSRTTSSTSFETQPMTPRGAPPMIAEEDHFPEASGGPSRQPTPAMYDDRPNMPGTSSHQHTASGDTEWAENSQARWVQTKLLLHQTQGSSNYDEYDPYGDGEYDDEYEDSVRDEDEADEEVNEIRFFNPSFLSETAVQLRDRVERGHHVKGGITWVGTFTGRDLVTTIQTLLPPYTRTSPDDRRFALITARSLQSQLWMVEVDWDDKPVRDSSDVVFKFMSEMEVTGDPLTIALPSGVQTMATRCYSPSCDGKGGCYAPRCPWKTPPALSVIPFDEESTSSRTPMMKNEHDWTEDIDPIILAELSDQQRKRQTLIRQTILEEEKYEADLSSLETVFIAPLLQGRAPIDSYHLEDLIQEIFGNVLEIRRAARRLIDNYAIRLREQSPLIHTVGDILLEAAVDFRSLYPQYTENVTRAEQLLTTTVEENKAFGDWLDQVSHVGDHVWDLRYLLKRPAVHLQKYPAALEEILKATAGNDPDYDFLAEALSSIQNISYLAQLKLYHATHGRSVDPGDKAANIKYYDIIPASVKESLHPKEFKRQMHIWELIEGELEYVRDLEAIETLYVDPLRNADTSIIDRSRLDIFLDDAFHNYRSLLEVHTRFLEDLKERQIEQHPKFGSVSDLILNAALNWHEAYMEYMPHYPIAKAKIDEEVVRNPAFANFLQTCLKNTLHNPGRHEINHYINRPISRLLRYTLLLKDILSAQIAAGPPDHVDIEAIPQIIDLIDSLAKAGQKGVTINTAKVELRHLNTTLDGGKFGSRAVKELDLLNPMRELIHQGKVYRQPEGSLSGAWSELQLYLFDNYFVLSKQTKPSKNRDMPVRFQINRRPIPLELFTLGEFSDPAQNRSMGLLKTIRGAGGGQHEAEGSSQQQSDSRTVYPFTYSFIGGGQMSGQYTLWTDSEKARTEWNEKLNHAKVLRDEVNDAGKVFEMTALSTDTFYQAPGYGVPTSNEDYTGRVTCSVPFTTVDRRNLVAVGCEQGVWIGVRHDAGSLRKVLHVRNVSQIAVLEDFGIFLVLADKSLLAYHLEALVPTAASPQVRSAPQRLSGVRDIVFFSVGQISGRTLVLYMKRKGMDSVFRVLEPIVTREMQDNRQRRGFGSLLGQRSEWFRVFKDFFIPTDALHVHFLKAKLAIVCAKGFEIMDLNDLKGGAIPIFDPIKQRERPGLAELQQMCDKAKPLAMFRSTDSEFLLCYDSFGIYVDRHGEPNRDCQPIEWEGRPESVVFHPPYLLLVSPSFIEIRHIDNAKLLQIHTGSDIRCTWDGTGGMSRPFTDQPGPKGWGDDITSQEPRIHICKRTDDARRTRGIGQHIYELTPTLLLNNPLLNPVYTQDPNYFPPAPMDYRTSIGTTLSAQYAYNNGNYPIPGDRQSVSSASTTPYPNGLGSPPMNSPPLAINTFPTPNPSGVRRSVTMGPEHNLETLASPTSGAMYRNASTGNRRPPPGADGYGARFAGSGYPGGGGYPGNYI